MIGLPANHPRVIGGAGFASSSLFSWVASMIGPVSKIVLGLAALGILITSLRMIASPDDEQVSTSMRQIRRVLVISVFLSCLGLVITEVFRMLGVSIYGIDVGLFNF